MQPIFFILNVILGIFYGVKVGLKLRLIYIKVCWPFVQVPLTIL